MARKPQKAYFSVATLNVKNLVLPNVRFYNRKGYSEKEYRDKLNWLAEQLYRMDADFVCLQEVFHDQALTDLNDRYTALLEQRETKTTARRNQYDYVEHFPNTRGSENNPQPGLALLSRREVHETISVQDIADRPIEVAKDAGLEYKLSELSRPLMIARVDLGKSTDGWIFNAHLKSKRPKYPSGSEADDARNALFYERAEGSFRSLALRSGEALALRREILDKARGSNTPVIVVGDLNDEIGAVTTEIVAGEQPWRREDLDTKKKFWDVELYSAVRSHQRRTEHSSVYTHIYNGHYGTIDHILISQEFYYRNYDRIGDIEFVQVFNDHLADDSLNRTPDVADASDHGQILVEMSIDPEKLEQLQKKNLTS